jgi:hypothetical protein
MDEDDPEKRIAELERQLAARRDVVPTPVSAGAPAHRTFVATAPRMNLKTLAILVVYGAPVALIGIPYAIHHLTHVATQTVGHWEHWLVLGGYAVLGLLITRSFRMRSLIYPKVSIAITGDSLEVTRGGHRGGVFPLSSATLGPWQVSGRLMGTALHLRNGRHRFVIGGQSYLARGAGLDAKPLWNVNAWMPAADFGELLAVVYR